MLERSSGRRSRTHPLAAGEPQLEAGSKFLSAAFVERSLRLASGAWKRRRLYALKLLSSTMAGLEARRGDHLIVEPGRRVEAGRMVVLRTDGRPVIRRVRETEEGRLVLAPLNPELLPFPTSPGRQTIVGTVIGVVPAAHGSSRPAGDRAPRVPGRRSASTRVGKTRELTPEELDRAVEHTHTNLRLWQGWVRTKAPAQYRSRRSFYWKRLEGRLATLAKCMENTGGTGLYAALVREADHVVARMRVEAVGLEGRAPAFRLLEAGREAQARSA